MPDNDKTRAFPNAVVPQRVTPGLVIVRHTGPEPEILLLQTNRWLTQKAARYISRGFHEPGKLPL
jgi:hypothetical protein